MTVYKTKRKTANLANLYSSKRGSHKRQNNCSSLAVPIQCILSWGGGFWSKKQPPKQL